MLNNLKLLTRRGLNLHSYSSLVVLDKALSHLSLKPQPQLHTEFRRMFSSENKAPENKGPETQGPEIKGPTTNEIKSPGSQGPENTGPENNKTKGPEVNTIKVEEKVWKSPTPLFFQNGEMKLFTANPKFRRNTIFSNMVLPSIFGSITVFSGFKLYDFENRAWYGKLLYSLLGGVALLCLSTTTVGNRIFYVMDMSLVNDGKHVRVATQRLGVQKTWEDIEINKIRVKPGTKIGVSLVFAAGKANYFMLGENITNLEVLKAIAEGYNIDTSNFVEETAGKK